MHADRFDITNKKLAKGGGSIQARKGRIPQYLRNHPNRHVLIQGNTDERGTTEYNLALGERRSEAVLHELETLGVPDSQLEAVSLGKEKPLAMGHDEASWAQNRRADLVYR